MARVNVKLHDRNLDRLLHGPNGAAAKDLYRRARAVESAAKRLCPVDQGRLRSSITTVLTTEKGRPVAYVGTNVKYARWVHDGTGIYGPARRPIRPVRARILRWPARRGSTGARGGYVYARQVRGVRPRPFLREALRQAGPR